MALVECPSEAIRVLFQETRRWGWAHGLWAISKRGKPDLAIIKGNLNAALYCQMVEHNLLPFAHQKYGQEFGSFILQQDDGPTRKAQKTKDFFKDWNVSLLNWPAKSPGPRSLENLWGILVRAVYQNGKKQYYSLKSLETAIWQEWAQVNQNLIDKLISSMPNCLFEVGEKQKTKHIISYMTTTFIFYYNFYLLHISCEQWKLL